MKLVEIRIKPAADGQLVRGVIREQRRAGSGWKTTKEFVVRSDEPGARRTLLLEDDERVIVEGVAARKLVIDPGQRAVQEVDDPDAEPPAASTTSLVGSDPMPQGSESQIGVWRVGSGDSYRTGKRYRKYITEE